MDSSYRDLDVLVNIPDERLNYFSGFYRAHGQLCYGSSCILNGSKIKTMDVGISVNFLFSTVGRGVEKTIFVVRELDTICEISIFSESLTSPGSLDSIFMSLSLTKRINLDCYNRNVIFKDVHHRFRQTLKRFIITSSRQLEREENFYIMKIPNQEVLDYKLEVPEGVELKELCQEDAYEIIKHWPHYWPQLDLYIHRLIQTTGGKGLFSVPNKKLLSWGLITLSGTIGFVQTLEDFRRKGYASYIIKVLATELVHNSQHPIAFVGTEDSASISFFEKLKFQNVGRTHDLHLARIDGPGLKKSHERRGFKWVLPFKKRQFTESPPQKDQEEAGASSVDPTSPTKKKEDAEASQLPDIDPTRKSPSQSPSKSTLKRGLLRVKKFSANILTSSLAKMGLSSANPTSPTLSDTATSRSTLPRSATRRSAPYRSATQLRSVPSTPSTVTRGTQSVVSRALFPGAASLNPSMHSSETPNPEIPIPTPSASPSPKDISPATLSTTTRSPTTPPLEEPKATIPDVAITSSATSSSVTSSSVTVSSATPQSTTASRSLLPGLVSLNLETLGQEAPGPAISSESLYSIDLLTSSSESHTTTCPSPDPNPTKTSHPPTPSPSSK